MAPSKTVAPPSSAGSSIHQGWQRGHWRQASHRVAATARRRGSVVPCPDCGRGNRRQDRSRERAQGSPHPYRRKQTLHRVGTEFAAHETVNQRAREYARGDVTTTNTVEGYFRIFKRGMRGNYQHCAEKNLHRYLAEFDFRYNTKNITDGERAVLAVRGGEGKRLTYRQPRYGLFSRCCAVSKVARKAEA